MTDEAIPCSFSQPVSRMVVDDMIERVRNGQEIRFLSLGIRLTKDNLKGELVMDRNWWPITQEDLLEFPADLLAVQEGKALENCQFPWDVLFFLFDGLRVSLLARGREMKPFIHPSAKISPHAVISGPVVIQEGVRIEPLAVVRGPVICGNGCVIESHARVLGIELRPNGLDLCTPVILEDGVWIRGAAEVSDSWISAGTTLDMGSRVRHCFVGRNGRLGEDTKFNYCILASEVRSHGVNFEHSYIGSRTVLGLGSHGYNTSARGTVRALPFGATEKVSTGHPHLGQIILQAFVAGDSSFQPGVMVGRGVFIKTSGMVFKANIPDGDSR